MIYEIYKASKSTITQNPKKSSIGIEEKEVNISLIMIYLMFCESLSNELKICERLTILLWIDFNI